MLRNDPFADPETTLTPETHRSARLHDSRLRQGATAPRRDARAPTPARSGPTLAGLTVTDGADQLTQAQVLERLGLAEDEFAQGIFARAGVRQRHLSLDAEHMANNLQGRTDRVEAELLAGAMRAIDDLGIDLQTIGTVVSSSLYSLGCPTLAHRLIAEYRMAPDTDKYHVTGVGCASAVPLLRLGVQALSQDPERDVLVVAADSMSSILMAGDADDPRAKTVGSAIFGDGCAAALLSSNPAHTGPAIVATKVHQIPGTLHAVALAAQREDSYLHLARDLPDIAASGLADLVAAFLAANGLSREDVSHWMVHPGGRRIVESVRDALALDDEDVGLAWQALADRGNVGTPSIFYVLRSTLDQRRPSPGEHGLAVTIGPGVTVGLMLLEF